MCVIGALLQLLLGSLDGSRSLFPPPAAVSVALGPVKKVVCYVEPSIAWDVVQNGEHSGVASKEVGY
jgi:hypothetical protein